MMERRGGDPFDRALVLGGVGGRLEEVRIPNEVPLGERVAVNVEAVGLCGTDSHIWRGEYEASFPCFLGHEVVGTVAEVGGEVRGVRVGDRVGVPWFQRGCGRCEPCYGDLIAHCSTAETWEGSGGGLKRHLVVHETALVKVPNGIPSPVAAPLMCAGFTAVSGLFRAHLTPGDVVAVVGLGGVGHLAVQIARAWGHRVIVATRDPSKKGDAEALGASLVVEYTSDSGESIRKAGGADVIAFCSPGDPSSAIRGLRPRGRLACLGINSGTLSIDLLPLVLGEFSVIGASHGSRGELLKLMDLCERGLVRPWTEAVEFRRAPEVFDMVARSAATPRYRYVFVE